MFHCLKFKRKAFIGVILFCIIFNIFFIYAARFLMLTEEIDCNLYLRNVNKTPMLENALFKFTKNFSVMNLHVDSKKWFQVSRDSYIYSAFYYKCPPNLHNLKCIQFIGITLNNSNSDTVPYLKCGFQRNSKIIKEDFAFIERLPEGHFLPFTAANFYCPLKKLEKNYIPEYATIYPISPTKWFKVEKIDFNKKLSISLSLCVRPLYGHYSELYLTQFFIYYVTMGFDHFQFYNYNASKPTLQYLNLLSSSHISLSVLPWNIPLNNSDVHEYGQIVFTQDCLARSRYRYSHTIIVDLDEFIVPKKHKTILDLIIYLDSYYPYAGSYVVPMVLFCDEYFFEKNYSLPILQRNKRQKTPWAHGYRSKYIARSDRVRYGGIHLVWKFEKGFGEVELSPSIALLHHYKPCCQMTQTWFFHLFNFNVLKDDGVVIDSTLLDHSPEVLNYTLIKKLLNSKAEFKTIRSLKSTKL